MASIILPASKSVIVTNKFPKQTYNSNYIKVGYKQKYNYISYLYFDISSIPVNIEILRAELVLFKVDNFYEDNSKNLIIYQLEDYFSSYTTYNNRPKVNRSIRKAFCPFTSEVYVTVDITKFVSLWFESENICTGIMMVSESNCIRLEFGSSKSNDSYIIPFIKIYYEGCCYNDNPTIRNINITGTVPPESKYEAIVDVEVTRHETGNKDNYYITDEYNNASGSEPLHIDKTYKIAIVPKESSNDSEKIYFYGSFKE